MTKQNYNNQAKHKKPKDKHNAEYRVKIQAELYDTQRCQITKQNKITFIENK